MNPSLLNISRNLSNITRMNNNIMRNIRYQNEKLIGPYRNILQQKNYVNINKNNSNKTDNDKSNKPIERKIEHPSNLMSQAKLYGDANNRCLEMVFKLKNDDYIFDIGEGADENCIYFQCQLKEDIILLYEYECKKAFEELKNLNQIFKECDNIEHIFNVLKKLFIELNEKTKPRIDMSNDKIILYFNCESNNDNFEEISIILEKNKRNLEEQLLQLQYKYVELFDNFKEIQKIAWSNCITDKKIEQIQNICGKPDEDEN